jgi:L-threonylcarbamoyladenylate synthase
MCCGPPAASLLYPPLTTSSVGHYAVTRNQPPNEEPYRRWLSIKRRDDSKAAHSSCKTQRRPDCSAMCAMCRVRWDRSRMCRQVPTNIILGRCRNWTPNPSCAEDGSQASPCAITNETSRASCVTRFQKPCHSPVPIAVANPLQQNYRDSSQELLDSVDYVCWHTPTRSTSPITRSI